MDNNRLEMLAEKIKHDDPSMGHLWAGQLEHMVAYILEKDGRQVPYGVDLLHILVTDKTHPCPAFVNSEWRGDYIGGRGYIIFIVRRKSFTRWARRHWQKFLITEDEHNAFMKRVDEAYNFELMLSLEDEFRLDE